MVDVWVDTWGAAWGTEPADVDGAVYYSTQVEIYDDADTDTLIDIIHARVDPTSLSELRAHGAGSFVISKRDAKVMANPSLIDYRKYVKIRMNGTVVGGFIIQTRRTVIVGDGEEADEAWALSGEGPRSWSRDAAVYPAKGLKAQSGDTRYFNFATEQGTWYNPTDWVTATSLWKWNVTNNWWGTAPANWPDAPNTFWVWSMNPYPSKLMPQGYNYFRHEVAVTTAASYSLFVAVDDAGEIYVDGELLLTTSDHAYSDTTRIDFELEVGDHVIGIKAYNYAGTGPGGLLAALFKYGDPEVPTSATLVSYTGQSTWKVMGYPTVEPGWSIGDVLLTLLNEAETRGVRFAQNWTPTFTADIDSSGVSWGDPIPWAFTVGATYEEVISAVEEMGCDIWVNPDTMAMHAWKKRGVNRSAEVTENAIVFLPGHNLMAAEETGQAEIANTLMLHAKDGWVEKTAVDTASVTKYGRVETQLSTQLSGVSANPLVDEVFRLKALPEKSATFDIIPVDGMVPFLSFNVGDIVSAPGEIPGILESRRVMSIAFNEDAATGKPQFSIEFDTIFKDRQTELEKWVSRIANSSAIGGGFTNSSILPPTSVQAPPGSQVGSVPDAPTGLIVSSVGHFGGDGTALSDYGLQWNAVVTGSGFGQVEITEYEVWARPITETESSLVSIVFDTFAYLPNYRSGDEWVFKVRAVSRTGGPGPFSPEVSLVAADPIINLGKPSTPTLSSSLGTVTIDWDGLIDGSPAPGYVRYLKVERTGEGSTATWEERRRNVFPSPYAVNLGRFSSTGGATVTLELRTDMPGPTTTSVRSTRTGTGDARLLDFIVGTNYPVSTLMRFRARVVTNTALSGLSVWFRPDVTSTTGEISADIIDLPAGESFIDVAASTGSTVPGAQAGISITSASSPVGSTIDVTDILFEELPNDGTMVAGDIVSGDPNERYRWLGTPGDSMSVFEELDPWIQVGTMVSGSTIDASAESGSVYEYRLIAIDTYGGESLPSDSASITVLGVQSGDITGGLASLNLVANGSFEGGFVGWLVKDSYPLGGSSAVVSSGSGISGAKYLHMERGTEITGAERELTVGQQPGNFIPISSVGSQGYFISAKVAGLLDYTAAFSLRAYWYQGDKVTPASNEFSDVVDAKDVTTTAQYFVGQVFPPDDARFLQVVLVAAIPESTIMVDDVVAREVISAGMIGDGAVIATHLSAGSVTANALQVGSVTADALAAGAVTADSIEAGAIQVSHLSSGVGSGLDISTNESVNILVNRTDQIVDDLGVTIDTVTGLTTYYNFTSEGAIIGQTESAFKLFLKNDRIEILENGIVVSYWDAGQMVVGRFVGEEVVLANHKIEKYGNGTVVKKL